jgi:hypothetical protein
MRTLGTLEEYRLTPNRSKGPHGRINAAGHVDTGAGE